MIKILDIATSVIIWLCVAIGIVCGVVAIHEKGYPWYEAWGITAILLFLCALTFRGYLKMKGDDDE